VLVPASASGFRWYAERHCGGFGEIIRRRREFFLSIIAWDFRDHSRLVEGGMVRGSGLWEGEHSTEGAFITIQAAASAVKGRRAMRMGGVFGCRVADSQVEGRISWGRGVGKSGNS